MELFNWLWVRHIPEKVISGNDYFYLWMSNDYEYQLVVEDWELRIYSYDYWSEDSIQSDHSWEDWWDYLYTCFEWMYDCFDRNTIRYIALNIEWMKIFDIAKEIVNWADRNMTDDVGGSIVENNDRTIKFPSSTLLKFIERALSKIGEKTYCYYK